MLSTLPKRIFDSRDVGHACWSWSGMGVAELRVAETGIRSRTSLRIRIAGADDRVKGFSMRTKGKIMYVRIDPYVVLTRQASEMISFPSSNDGAELVPRRWVRYLPLLMQPHYVYARRLSVG